MEVADRLVFNKALTGKRIKESRELSGYTQKSLADELGLSRTSVANYELGITTPPPVVLFNISTLCDVSVDFLIGKSNEKTIQ